MGLVANPLLLAIAHKVSFPYQGSTAAFEHIQVKTKSEMMINQLSNTTLRVFEIKGIMSFSIKRS